MLHFEELVGQCRVVPLVFLKRGEPGITKLWATHADPCAKMRANLFGNEENSLLWPAIIPFRQADLLRAKRLAMRGTGALLSRRTVANMAVDDDQCWAGRRLRKALEGAPMRLGRLRCAPA
jgi:hypothetical protein